MTKMAIAPVTITVTSGKYANFIHDYFNLKKYPEERLGQAFLNHCIEDVEDNILFYEEDNKKAIDRIRGRYITVK